MSCHISCCTSHIIYNIIYHIIPNSSKYINSCNIFHGSAVVFSSKILKRQSDESSLDDDHWSLKRVWFKLSWDMLTIWVLEAHKTERSKKHHYKLILSITFISSVRNHISRSFTWLWGVIDRNNAKCLVSFISFVTSVQWSKLHMPNMSRLIECVFGEEKIL